MYHSVNTRGNPQASGVHGTHNSASNTTGSINNRRLSQSEYQGRRGRNQCFFCDETFKPWHNCRKGQAMLIEVLQDEVESLIDLGPENVDVAPVVNCE